MSAMMEEVVSTSSGSTSSSLASNASRSSQSNGSGVGMGMGLSSPSSTLVAVSPTHHTALPPDLQMNLAMNMNMNMNMGMPALNMNMPAMAMGINNINMMNMNMAMNPAATAVNAHPAASGAPTAAFHEKRNSVNGGAGMVAAMPLQYAFAMPPPGLQLTAQQQQQYFQQQQQFQHFQQQQQLQQLQQQGATYRPPSASSQYPPNDPLTDNIDKLKLNQQQLQLQHQQLLHQQLLQQQLHHQQQLQLQQQQLQQQPPQQALSPPSHGQQTLPISLDSSSIASSSSSLSKPASAAALNTVSSSSSSVSSGLSSNSTSTSSSSPASATSSKSGMKSISYAAERVIGNGSFGVVYQASVIETGETVAIKKVLQDRRFKNRELQIMGMLDHPDVIMLKHCFYSKGEKAEEVYLNLVMEYVPETVHRTIRNHTKAAKLLPLILTKMYLYQICRGVAYIHSLGVSHRDIKPQNLLLNSKTHQVKLCDFGSAKMLVPGEPNVSYICSRYYRAPELVFEATQYTCAIDIWSLGCVFAEMLLGTPLFPGDTGVDQLIEIIKILGTPSREEIHAMNPNHQSFKFPQIKSHPWPKVFRGKAPDSACDLVASFLKYDPRARLDPLDALAHDFFDELRDPNAKLPNGKPIPNVFNFTENELRLLHQRGLLAKVVPKHVIPTLKWPAGVSPPLAP